jgi:hypothetical protein
MSDNPFAEREKATGSRENPYQSPVYTTAPKDVGGSDADFDGAANMLRQTKPWVRFVSVIMLIASAFMVLGGAFMMLAGAAATPGTPGAFLGLIYMVMAVLYIVPAVFLWRYADRIDIFLRQRSPRTLASALEAQKSFWKFVGILTLIVLCVYAFAILFAIFAGVASTM